MSAGGVARLCVALGAVLSIAIPASAPATAQALRLVGHSDLGGEGLNGAISVVGTTAIVAAGVMPAGGVHAHLFSPYTCPAVDVKLVDVSQPSAPRVVGRIPVPAGVAAHDVSARRVRTAWFAGDLAAIALVQCGGEGAYEQRGVVYYDVTDPARPRLLGRYYADSDREHASDVPPCGPPPAASSARCASSQHTVQLVEWPDGRLISLSTEPGASAAGYPSGDLRIVDVTDPHRPTQLSSFPRPNTPIFSTNGCRPFSAAHDARAVARGPGVLLAFYDGGLIQVDLSDVAAPVRVGAFEFANERSVEGNAGYVATAIVGGAPVALLSEQDWIAVETRLEIVDADGIPSRIGACQAIFTLFDPERRSAIFAQPGGAVSGEFVYAGRGCPAGAMIMMGHDMAGPSGAAGVADPYMAATRGRIVLLDRTQQPTQPDIGSGAGCSVAARTLRAQEAGARAVVIAQTATASPLAFSPDGHPSGITIPVVQIDKVDGDRLRDALCPSVRAGRCVDELTLRGRLVDEPGDWGGVRLLDLSDPAKPRQLDVYHSPTAARFPPPDAGVYAPNRAVIDGTLAFVAWNSDGVRGLDIGSGRIREVAAFVPPDTQDPSGNVPSKSYVIAVALLGGAGGGSATHVLASDMNSGLYVLEIVR